MVSMFPLGRKIAVNMNGFISSFPVFAHYFLFPDVLVRNYCIMLIALVKVSFSQIYSLVIATGDSN